MDSLVSLLVLSTLPQLVPAAPPVTPVRAVVQLVSGESRVFSGESVRMKCSVPDESSPLDYLWFLGSEQLSPRGEHFYLWRARVQQSGKYYCQGVTARGVNTLRSLPVELNVDGGWAILQVAPRPSLVGDTLKVTCRVRATPELHEVILYKDGTEIKRQNGPNPHFYLTNLTLGDEGMYACRASWDADRRTRSVISVYSPVQVLEVLSQPVLEIVADDNLIPENKMKLICHVQYNARAPAPPVHYYFYKNNNQLGSATSENQNLVKQTPGQYSCKAKVQELGLSGWSEPKDFGPVRGAQTVKPSTFPPSDPQWPLAPPVSSPDHSLPPAAEPTAARPSPTATPPFIQPSHPAPSTLQSTPQAYYSPATAFDIYEENGEMSGSGDEESGDMPEESGDMSDESGDMSDESGDMSGESGDMSGEPGDKSDFHVSYPPSCSKTLVTCLKSFQKLSYSGLLSCVAKHC
ncbi:high affinity immunoglobulin gamma Fc receptor I-like [Centropristis striata]|uniref:high affinity immunoglobulin gamma Fc receptor I-like n=1 Tax=Centropristis striata TaxID=184440 RepID=UPI0027E0642E|nr:high affinity immunoglobulin gamma Fc receptor I-like [Centropristis striata]